MLESRTQPSNASLHSSGTDLDSRLPRLRHADADDRRADLFLTAKENLEELAFPPTRGGVYSEPLAPTIFVTTRAMIGFLLAAECLLAQLARKRSMNSCQRCNKRPRCSPYDSVCDPCGAYLLDRDYRDTINYAAIVDVDPGVAYMLGFQEALMWKWEDFLGFDVPPLLPAS